MTFTQASQLHTSLVMQYSSLLEHAFTTAIKLTLQANTVKSILIF